MIPWTGRNRSLSLRGIVSVSMTLLGFIYDEAVLPVLQQHRFKCTYHSRDASAAARACLNTTQLARACGVNCSWWVTFSYSQPPRRNWSQNRKHCFQRFLPNPSLLPLGIPFTPRCLNPWSSMIRFSAPSTNYHDLNWYCETWPILVADERTLAAFDNDSIRCILHMRQRVKMKAPLRQLIGKGACKDFTLRSSALGGINK